MRMCIIMSMNIYIKPDIEEKLRRYDGSMSGLINRLLADFFEKNPTAATGGYKTEDKEHETLAELTPAPENIKYPNPVKEDLGVTK